MEEPPVDAFWSITVYDSERGGHFHPNKDDRYHINNTAAVKNEDGTITFTFKTSCATADLNCLEVPAGKFDVAARYYLPHQEIQSGEWVLPGITLVKSKADEARAIAKEAYLYGYPLLDGYRTMYDYFVNLKTA
jgi:hypothetical protein